MLRNKLAKYVGRGLSSVLIVSSLLVGNAALANSGGHDWDSKHQSSLSDWTHDADVKWDQYFDAKWNDSPAHNQHQSGGSDIAFFLFLPDTFDSKELFKLVKYASWLDQDVSIFTFIGKVDYQEIFSAWTNANAPVPAPVPEPETYGLMAAGLGMLGVMAKRRRKSKS